jgi:hypothetical protein
MSQKYVNPTVTIKKTTQSGNNTYPLLSLRENDNIPAINAVTYFREFTNSEML